MLEQSQLDHARFPHDNPALYGFKCEDRQDHVDEVKSRFLSRHVQITDSLFPEIAETVHKATSWLLGEKRLQAFISADEDINAACIPGPGDLPIIWISSGLIKTLEPEEQLFVIGHELGHWYYGHHSYPDVEPFSGPRFVARQHLSRAAEISADRFGLVICRNLETCLKAAIKTASGLSEQFLGTRVSEFIAQARSIEIKNIDHGELFATHPPMVIRARALMWFSMSDLYCKLSNAGQGGLDLDTVNRRVGDDLVKVLGKGFTRKQSDDIREAVFWMTISEIAAQGGLSKADQQLVSETFGEELVQRLKNLLTGKSKSQVQEETLKRALEACETMTAYSSQEFEAFLKEHSQIAKHVNGFMSRFKS